MENKQYRYLDKVVEFLVRDTKIDYDKDEIQFPFSFPLSRSFRLSVYSFSFLPSSFSKYCKNIYGLTDQELEYVWKEYKEKVENGK